MNNILTTDRPLSDDDRRNLWRDKWRVQFDPKPIPGHDWSWSHVDFDGAPDSGDTRCGTASSAADAIQQINEITSPTVQGQPQGVSFSSMIFGALGFVLAVGIPVALVIIAAVHMETGL